MCDVGEWASVYECGRVFGCLHQVGQESVFQQYRDRSGHTEIVYSERLVIVRISQQDVADTAFQVFDVRCQAKDRHDFRSGCDVKTCLRRYTVGRSAQAGNNVAQAAVIHVQYAFPFDFFQTFTGITRLVDVIVQQCRDHIVGRSNRMEIPRKMQVDVFHRQHLRVSASGSSALHAEAWTQ